MPHMNPADEKSAEEELGAAYDQGTFGVSRRAFISLAAAAGVAAYAGSLVFPEQHEALAEFTQTDTTSFPTLTDEGKVRFTMHSDTHVGANTNNNFYEKVPYAFSRIYEIAPDIDAHFFIGDSADHGTEEEYEDLADLLNAYAQAPVALVMGNHEYYHARDLANEDDTVNVPLTAIEAFEDFLTNKLAVEGSAQILGGECEGQPDFDIVVGGDGTEGSGYHVIGMSAHVGGINYSYYGDRRQWAVRHIEDAVAEDPNKPVFLISHHPFHNTVAKSIGTGNEGQYAGLNTNALDSEYEFFEELSEKFPQLIHFSGHTHVPMANPHSINQDGFTQVQTATFGNCFWMKDEGYVEGGDEDHPLDGRDASQCELVEIDRATNVVTIYRLDFREGAVIGEPWVIDPSTGAEGFQYTPEGTREAAGQPIVEEGCSVTVPEETLYARSARFELTADKVHADTDALPNDVIISYRIVVRKGDQLGDVVYESKFMTDYYRAAQNRETAFNRPLFGARLKPATDYLLTAYAVSAYDKQAKIGEVSFTTPER
jgi:predicted MPP superfamily phosphohydrolase